MTVSTTNRFTRTDVIILAAGVGLAVAAAVAAQMGVPKAQPLVGAIVILGIAWLLCNRNRYSASLFAGGSGMKYSS